MSEHELELYIAKQNAIFTSQVIDEFTKAVMVRRVWQSFWIRKVSTESVSCLKKGWESFCIMSRFIRKALHAHGKHFRN